MFYKHLLRMKQFLTFPIFLLLANLAFAQVPLNDNCSGAITLTSIAAGGVCPTDIYTNVGASDALGISNSPNPSLITSPGNCRYRSATFSAASLLSEPISVNGGL